MDTLFLQFAPYEWSTPPAAIVRLTYCSLVVAGRRVVQYQPAGPLALQLVQQLPAAL